MPPAVRHFIVEYTEIPNWVHERTSSILNIISSLKNIINVALPKFIGEPGIPSDLKGLYYISLKYAELYEQVLNWIIITRSTQIGEDFEEARIILADFGTKPAKDIWNFPFDVYQQITDANEKYKLGEKNITINSTLTLEIEEGVEKKFNEITEKLRAHYNAKNTT